MQPGGGTAASGSGDPTKQRPGADTQAVLRRQVQPVVRADVMMPSSRTAGSKPMTTVPRGTGTELILRAKVTAPNSPPMFRGSQVL